MAHDFDARAWRAGEDIEHLARRLQGDHDEFLRTGSVPGSVRPLVAESWRRSLTTGVDPEVTLPPVELLDDDLALARTTSPLAPVMPVIRRLLVEDAADAGLLVAVSDHLGRLLWVEGGARERGRAEQIHFVEGACWAEGRAGTNAPGTALAIGQPVQIYAAEHLVRRVVPWSCTAAPIRDPYTGAVLGALDLTGGAPVAAPQTLALVRATVAAVEAELALRRERGATLTAPARPDRAGAVHDAAAPVTAWRLRLLGRAAGVLETPDGARRLSLRHSELLAILAARPAGSSAEELAAGLYDHPGAEVSVRAEVVRLRSAIAPVALASRPYRLPVLPATDVDVVRDLIAAGRVRDAVEAYEGELLPRSEAPAVVRLRHDLHHELRGALLAGGDVDALVRFGATEEGMDDWQVWSTALAATPPGSPRRAYLQAQVAAIDARQAVRPRG